MWAMKYDKYECLRPWYNYQYSETEILTKPDRLRSQTEIPCSRKTARGKRNSIFSSLFLTVASVE